MQSIRHALRFCGQFALVVFAQVAVFELLPGIFSSFHLLPISWLATQILGSVGVHAELITHDLAAGFCRLDLSGVQYAVTHECTGILAVFVVSAAVIAYPVAWRSRLRGLALAVPAVSLFGILRLVILGIVAQSRPDWIEVFHIYIMELATLAFAMYVFIYWIEDLREPHVC